MGLLSRGRGDVLLFFKPPAYQCESQRRTGMSAAWQQSGKGGFLAHYTPFKGLFPYLLEAELPHQAGRRGVVVGAERRPG